MKEILGKTNKKHLSPAIKANGFIYISGQTAGNEKGDFPKDIEQQTKIVLDKIKLLLKEANSSMENVIKTTVFITDTSEYEKMNKIYCSYFADNPPTRSCVKVELMKKDLKVEIEAVAAI